MAITVIFGLSFATLITLVLVPCVTSWFDHLGNKFRNLFRKKKKKNIPVMES